MAVRRNSNDLGEPLVQADRDPSVQISASSPAVTFANNMTVDEILEEIGVGKWQIVILCSQCLLAWTAAALLQMMEFLSGCAGEDWSLSSLKQALLTSAIYIGGAITATPWGIFSDRSGRKISLMTYSSCVSVIAFLSAASPNYAVLLPLRILTGMCLGAKAFPYAYVSEVMPPSWRARFTSILSGVWSLGSLYVNVMAWILLTSLRVGLGWRILVIVCVFPAAVAFLMMSRYLSESPRWLLIQHKREREALEALRYIGSQSNMKRALVLPDDVHLTMSVPNSPAPPRRGGGGGGGGGASSNVAAAGVSAFADESPSSSPTAAASGSRGGGGGGGSDSGPMKASRKNLEEKHGYQGPKKPPPFSGSGLSSSIRSTGSGGGGGGGGGASRYAPSTSKLSFHLLWQPKFLVTNVCLTTAWLMQGFVFFGIVDFIQLLAEGDSDSDDDDDSSDSCSFNFLTNNVSCVGQVCVCLLIIMIIDKCPRKAIALTCFFIVAASMPFFAAAGWSKVSRTDAEILQIFGAFVGRGAASGAFSLLFTMTPELYPTDLRATVICLSVMMQFISAIAVPYWISCNAVNNAGKAALLAVAAMIGFLAVLPMRETSQGKLGDMDEVKARTASGSYVIHDGGFTEDDEDETTDVYSNNGSSDGVVAAAGGKGGSSSGQGASNGRVMRDEVQDEEED